MKKLIIAGACGLLLLASTTGCTPLEELSKVTAPEPAPAAPTDTNAAAPAAPAAPSLGLPPIINPAIVKTEGDKGNANVTASNPAITLSWNGANLVVAGSGFAGGETVRVAIKATSKQDNKVQRPGVFSVSSNNASSNIQTMAKAKPDGTLSVQSMLIMPAGSEVVVTASGDKGSSAEAHTETPAR